MVEYPHYLQGFIHPRWLFGISSINRSTYQFTYISILASRWPMTNPILREVDSTWHGGPFIKGGTHQSLVWKVMGKISRSFTWSKWMAFFKKKIPGLLEVSQWFIPPCKKTTNPLKDGFFSCPKPHHKKPAPNQSRNCLWYVSKISVGSHRVCWSSTPEFCLEDPKVWAKLIVNAPLRHSKKGGTKWPSDTHWDPNLLVNQVFWIEVLPSTHASRNP